MVECRQSLFSLVGFFLRRALKPRVNAASIHFMKRLLTFLLLSALSAATQDEKPNAPAESRIPRGNIAVNRCFGGFSALATARKSVHSRRHRV